MNIIRAENYKEMSQLAAKKLVEQINEKSDSVLGLATGSTPEGLYEEIIKAHKEDNISFKDVTTFNLDEYVGLNKDNHQSYYYYMHHLLFNHIDINGGQVNLPNGDAHDLQEECNRYEKAIKQAGGVDIQILGIGLNGHIGFNEPGTPFSMQTHIIDLDESTRQANARFFDSIDDVPSQAITMGIDTIMQSKQIILIVSGSQKAEALEKLVNGPVTEDFPASILQQHANVTIIANRDALSELSK
ncbi:glucosamine-6-phosphate deaminase [Oceanobacillus timonensis]|uniref:glucosamine-6-phosphate deaminase n=1 Tax=Oceanobacillus timonensis TaxID=1926285 RepID=UPI0009BBF6F5|nr:glucosamine-6-phosphate deaminase [Oceanobacillus timonensis]